MTPNNTTKTPLIQRIFDSLGGDHTVTPTPHTHSQDEVAGLETALSNINTSLSGKVSSSDMTTALAGKADKVSGATNNNFAALDGNGNIKDSGKKASDFANSIPSGSPSGAIVIASNSGQIARSDKTLGDLMPATTIDTTPTADSDHLVTSGGVYQALASKRFLAGQTISLIINRQEIEIESSDVPNLIRALTDPDSTPKTNSDNLVTSGGVKAALDAALAVNVNSVASAIDVNALPFDRIIPIRFLNATNNSVNLYDIFSFSNVTTQTKNLSINSDNVEIPGSSAVFALILKKYHDTIGTNTTLYVWYQGIARTVTIE